MSETPDDDTPTPTEYARVFNGSPAGKRVWAQLNKLFLLGAKHEMRGGIDGIRQSDVNAGKRSVIHFVQDKINEATLERKQPKEQ